MTQGPPTTYRGNIWRLFTAQALLMFILWVPIWVVLLSALLSELGTAAVVPLLMTAADLLDPPSAIGVPAALFAITFVPLWFVWRSADARKG